MASALSGPLVGHRHLKDTMSVAARRELRVGDRTVIAVSDGYLNSAGYHNFSVSALGNQAIEVSVTITEPTRFLSLIGVGSFTCTRSATASLVTGVTGGT